MIERTYWVAGLVPLPKSGGDTNIHSLRTIPNNPKSIPHPVLTALRGTASLVESHRRFLSETFVPYGSLTKQLAPLFESIGLIIVIGKFGRIVMRAKGLEPSPEAWKAAVLPLHHTRDVYT